MSSIDDRPPTPTEALAGAARAGESLDQVRDLLFGGELRSYDRRLQRIEERIAREITALRSDLKQRLDSMHAEVKGAVASVSNTISDEQRERNRRNDAVIEQMSNAAQAVEARLEELREEAAVAHEELRLSGIEEGQSIRTDVAASRIEDQKRLARMFAQLARVLDESTGQAPKGPAE